MITNGRDRRVKALVVKAQEALMLEACRRCAAWKPTRAFAGRSASASSKPKPPLGPAPPKTSNRGQPTATATLSSPNTSKRSQSKATAPTSTAQSVAPKRGRIGPGPADSSAPTVMSSLQALPKHAQQLLRMGGVKALAIDALQKPAVLSAHRYAAPHNPASAMVVVIADIVAQVNGGTLPRFTATTAPAAVAAEISAPARVPAAATGAGAAPTHSEVAATVSALASQSPYPDEPLYTKLERLGVFLVGSVSDGRKGGRVGSRGPDGI